MLDQLSSTHSLTEVSKWAGREREYRTSYFPHTHPFIYTPIFYTRFRLKDNNLSRSLRKACYKPMCLEKKNLIRYR